MLENCWYVTYFLRLTWREQGPKFQFRILISGQNICKFWTRMLVIIGQKNAGFVGQSRSQIPDWQSLKPFFWVSTFDPRMPSQRKIISRNYHIFAADPNFAKLFPRKNLVSGSRRQPNLLELLSPTVPRRAKSPPPGQAPAPPAHYYQGKERHRRTPIWPHGTPYEVIPC